MKKVFCIIILFFAFFTPFSFADALKAGVSKEYVPEGFFGSWAVISKIIETNNHGLFNSESKDNWIMSGYSNRLLLQNLGSGARSEIIIKEKSITNKTLKFEREKTVKKSDTKKIVYKETVEFALTNDYNFKGIDNFIVEDWQNGKLVKRNYAKYKVSGIKIVAQN